MFSTTKTSTFTKADASDKTGVGVGERRGKVVISNVLPGSLAADSAPELRRGLEVVSINGTEVQGMSSAEAAKLLIEAVGEVTIKTADYQSHLSC